MTSVTVDFSSMAQMPDTIRVKLSGGAIVEFELPSFKKVEAPRPKTTAFGPRKFYNSTRDGCNFGVLCNNKYCKTAHPSVETEQQAIIDGSSEDIHEYIKEIFDALDDKRIKIFLHTIKLGKFVPYQSNCDDDLNCKNLFCARKHEQGDKRVFENISERAIEAVQKMKYKTAEESS